MPILKLGHGDWGHASDKLTTSIEQVGEDFGYQLGKGIASGFSRRGYKRIGAPDGASEAL